MHGGSFLKKLGKSNSLTPSGLQKWPQMAVIDYV